MFGKHVVFVKGHSGRDRLLPPEDIMCDKCFKIAIGKEIADLEIKVERLFDKMMLNPEVMKHDAAFIQFADKMDSLLKKYEELK
jgi:hypothetical protein